MNAAIKITETGGYIYNLISILFIITIGIVLISVTYYLAYQDPIDTNKRSNKITITFLVFGLFIVGISCIIGGIQYSMLINSDVGYMINTATGIRGIKNIVTRPFRR